MLVLEREWFVQHGNKKKLTMNKINADLPASLSIASSVSVKCKNGHVAPDWQEPELKKTQMGLVGVCLSSAITGDGASSCLGSLSTLLDDDGSAPFFLPELDLEEEGLVLGVALTPSLGPLSVGVVEEEAVAAFERPFTS